LPKKRVFRAVSQPVAASGHGHSAHRYQHIEAVFVSHCYLDHLSPALAGKPVLIFPQHCEIAAHSMKSSRYAVALRVDAASCVRNPMKEYDHEDRDHFSYPSSAWCPDAAVAQG
jgi:hypothetical protein